MWLGLAIAGAGAAVWTWRLAALRPAPTRMARGRVSIIVPARNEAHNLPALLDSLAGLYPPAHEVIVVDDGSTDGTAAVARRHGARVVTPRPLPEGWLGKPWACAEGAAAAAGDLLLFTDADTIHAPASLGWATACLDRADLVSVVPVHRAVSCWEKLQGVFQLLLLVATGAGAPRRRGERSFAIGQYLLFTRAAYERIGGHAAVKDRVAEDLAFARLVGEGGGRVGLVHAPGLLAARMYPEGLGAFIRGWRRNFREGVPAAGPGGTLELVLVIGWLLGLPLAALSDPPLFLPAVAVTAAEVARRQRLVGAFPRWSALFYPVAVAVFAGVTLLTLWDMARRAPVVWRGRRFVPGPR